MLTPRLRASWEYLRGTYWAVPSAVAVAAFALSVGMIQLDQAATANLLDRLSWVYRGGPEGARAVLSTIAASMITVAGVTFSITIVALTLASQQFGPRLLRNFLRDPDDRPRHIRLHLYLLPPRAANGPRRRRRRVRAASGGDRRRPSRNAEEGAAAVRATATGHVQVIDAQGLVDVARKRNVVVRVHARPGAFVRKGLVLLTVGPTPPEGDADDAPFHELFIIGSSRNGTQDATFFMDQLVELPVRALSPGINDPGTARLCIDRIEQALCQLAGRRIPSSARRDDEGVVRVLACPLTFAGIMENAFSEIARYGRSSVSVTCRLLEAVRSVGSCVRREADRRALLRQAAETAEPVRGAPFSEGDRERIARTYRATILALHAPSGD